ncbi:PH domain-containing protein [Flavobacterium lacus]|uniref:Putative membrane protein n=1 Tax=Flavobacterium lacus TaxID=1353778 RepID=A0A328WQL2_9FLAO|nr:PH domain-containing protein [Flavobacterium lacus]RAR46657.1 putative membrane protein [Flavobacterium lacus]
MYDFSKPQRQSVKGIAIMFADTLQGIIRGLWAPILLVIYKFDWSKMYFLIFGFLILLLLIGVIAYLKYINFTYFLDEEKQEFVIQKGVITKNNITIQLDKIQQVNINQSVVQKLVGVFSVDIDTAGSNKKEASIRAVDNQVALHLKNKLLSFEKTTIDILTDESSLETEKPFLKISFLTLLKVGITSNYGRSIALLIGFVGTLYGGFHDVVTSFEVDEEEVNGLVDRGLGYFSLSFFLIGVMVLVLLINLIRTVVKYFEYQMVIQRKALAITHGLFAKKNTLLKPAKVQITAFSQNFFQRKLNLFDLRLKQASSTDEAGTEGKSSNDIEVPGCSPAEKEAILQMILDKIPTTKEILKPNFRYLIKAILFGIFFPCAIFTFMGLFVFEALQSFFPVMIAYVLLMGMIVFFQFRNYRLLLSLDFITLKGNAWDVQHQLIEPFKIQGITTKQYLWHKRSDVVHLTFHTAAGDLSFKFANYSALKPWINYWLYQVERSNQNWM